MDTAAILEPSRGELLARVECSLREELSPVGDAHPLLQAAARHLCLAEGAKRVRPMLALLFAEIAGAPAEDIAEVALVTELVHSASLLHDDVVDMGETRRGAATVNAVYGNSVAVLAGDHLLSRALLRLSVYPRELTTRSIEVVAEMSRAAMIEVESRGDLSFTWARYREMAIGKTGALFGLCGLAAGVLAGNPVVGAKLDEVGRRLGLAFQMQDDLDDLVGLDKKEDRCGDLRERTPSVITLFACATPDLRALVATLWSTPAVTSEAACTVGAALLASGVAEQTLAAIAEELAAVREIAAELPSCPAMDEVLYWAHKKLGVDPRG